MATPSLRRLGQVKKMSFKRSNEQTFCVQTSCGW
jgi:hypothetical protein